MGGEHAADTEELIGRAGLGDAAARERLLARHRARLRRMVAVRLDRRLGPRLDPSDVVQEALAEASKRLDGFLRRRPLPFYPWLRQFARAKLVDLHRRHVACRRRSVDREEAPGRGSGSPFELAGSGTSPSRSLIRDEQRDAVGSALQGLPPRDREVLIMRHVEQMAVAEIAAALQIREGAVKARLLRALIRLRAEMEAAP